MKVEIQTPSLTNSSPSILSHRHNVRNNSPAALSLASAGNLAIPGAAANAAHRSHLPCNDVLVTSNTSGSPSGRSVLTSSWKSLLDAEESSSFHQVVVVPNVVTYIAPTTTSTTSSVEDKENEQDLKNLRYKRIELNVDSVDGLFFRRALERQSVFQSIAFYRIFPALDRPNELPITDRAFIALSENVAYIEASRPVTQSNKESLCTLFDLVDESSCETMVACVDKDSVDMRNIIQSYLSIGFYMTKSVQIPGYVLLAKDL